MIKLPIKLGILLLAAVSAGLLWQQTKLITLALSRIDPIPETRDLIAKEHYAEASDYLGFFMGYDYVGQTPEAQDLYRDISNKRNSWRYQANKLAEGLFWGTSDETIGKVAGVATDLIVLGDLRDLTKQGVHLAQGEEVDKVLVVLASFGAIATGAQIASGSATVATGGAAAPTMMGATAAKSGLVVLKTARKLGKLPPWLGKTLVKSAKTVKKTKSLKSLNGILGDVTTLAKTRGGFNLLSKAQDAASLRRMAIFAETFGPNSATLYRIGGDMVVNITQQAGNLGKNTIQLAATYGKGGLRVLDRFGAINFVKYSARASKIATKGDGFHLLAKLLLMLPHWILYMLVALGAFIWLPLRTFFNFGIRLRQRPNKKSGIDDSVANTLPAR
jgi:hypothetical protein